MAKDDALSLTLVTQARGRHAARRVFWAVALLPYLWCSQVADVPPLHVHPDGDHGWLRPSAVLRGCGTIQGDDSLGRPTYVGRAGPS